MTRRELAEIGVRLGDDGEVWKTALRALAMVPHDDIKSDPAVEFVAGQIYAAAADDADPEDADAFAKAFIGAYDLEDVGDVDRLLGRERHERDNYEGQLGIVRAGGDA